ncbi:MAG TPA: hypothetical protein VHC67_15475 [Gaiellaceae bacterium]|nr:hypothetical protein [Gaiellaceae bacterium]
MKTTLTARLGQLAHDWDGAPRREYAYILGMYRCRDGVAVLMPRERPSRAVDVSSCSQLWPELIPQHGRGPKHTRPIRLANPVRSSAGRLYLYDRYVFSNRSADIKGLFRWAC